MLVLGQDGNDKGTQLEQIAQAMLSDKGFQNITLNAVRAGSAEYDVTAVYVMPGLGSGAGRRISVVGECKARKDAINMDDWQKFMGKVILETITKGHDVQGLFITTSELRSTVTSCYEELLVHPNNNIELVDATQIENFLKNKYSVCSLQKIAGLLSNFTDKAATSIDLCYYQQACYWLVKFGKAGYTLLDSEGKPLQGESLDEIRGLIEKDEASTTFVNLNEEAEARRRSIHVQQHILARLMLYNGVLGETELFENASVSPEELHAAISLLEEKGWLEQEEGIVRFTAMDEEGRYGHFIDVAKFWLRGEWPVAPLHDMLRSEFYDRHVDERLLDEIIMIQANLPIPEAERKDVLRILKLSPTALIGVLYPIQLITEGRTEGDIRKEESINETDRNLLYQVLIFGLVHDYRTRGMEKYLLDVRGILELEYRLSVAVTAKNPEGIDAALESRSRHMVRSSNVQGGYIHLLNMASAPEPWEETKAKKQNKAEKNAGNLEPPMSVPELSK
jgi:hypothetical protein